MTSEEKAVTATIVGIVLLVVIVIVTLVAISPVLGRRNARISVESKRYAVQKAALVMCQRQIQGGVLTDRCIELTK